MNSIATIFLFIFIMLYIAGIILKLNKLEESLSKLKTEFEFKKGSLEWTIDRLIGRIHFNEESISNINKQIDQIMEHLNIETKDGNEEQ